MPYLGSARINFDQVGVVGAFGQHEIETVKTRESEAAGDFFCGFDHSRVLDPTYDCGVAEGMALLQHRKVKAGQDRALPAERGAGSIAAGYKGLCVDYGPALKQRRPDQCGVAVEKSAFGGPSKKWRRSQFVERPMG